MRTTGTWRTCWRGRGRRASQLQLSKSTICAAEVKWFRRVYSAAGVSADPDKIHHIVQAGRPETIKDIRSLLQAAAYNAKYGLDHNEKKTYKKVTAPLRQLLVKDATFRSDDHCEDGFQTLLRMMNSRTYLAPHNPKRKTHLVTDASPCGIAASLYQKDTRASGYLRSTPLGCSPSTSQIDWESLAKGILMFWPYLIGVHFTSWGDHKPCSRSTTRYPRSRP